MTALQNVISILMQETKHRQMYLNFETNNRNYGKATRWLAHQIKFLRLIDLLTAIQSDINNKINPLKLNEVMEGLQSELLNCQENINYAVQKQQTENYASLRDEEKKFEELIKLLSELELW